MSPHPAQAATGTLAIMVGVDDEAFATVQPLLPELGQAITHVGTNGQSLLLKLAVNVSLAVQTLASSEGRWASSPGFSFGRPCDLPGLSV